MQRNIILGLAALVILLAATLAFVLLRDRSGPAPVASPTINAAEEQAPDPYHREMDCIDRLIQNNTLTANQVEPALANCRSEAAGNRSAAQ